MNRQKQKPTLLDLQRRRVTDRIEAALSASPVIEIHPRRLAGGLHVALSLVIDAIDQGEQCGKWSVRHLDTGAKILRKSSDSRSGSASAAQGFARTRVSESQGQGRSEGTVL